MVIILGFQTSNTYTCSQRYHQGSGPAAGRGQTVFSLERDNDVTGKAADRYTVCIRIISNPVAWVFQDQPELP
jgi:hypothetical protein